MKSLGLQLYTVRQFFTNEKETEKCLEKVYEAGYREVQLAGDFESIEKTGMEALKKGFKVLGYTTDFGLIEKAPERAIALLKQLDAFDASVGLFGSKCSEEVREFIGKANICAECFAKNGVKLSYHNHSHEFERMENGKTIFDMLIDESDLSFVPDTYWLQHAGVDVRDMLEKLSGRFDIIHLKDMKIVNNTPTFAEIGEGNLNWDGIIETAKRSGAKYFVVEQDSCDTDPIESIKKSQSYISKYFMEDIKCTE